MTAVPVSELPADLQRRLAGKVASSRKRARLSTAGSGGWNLRCAACHYDPRSPTRAGRHTAETGHSRWEMVL